MPNPLPTAILLNTTTGRATRFNSFGAACLAAATNKTTGYVVSPGDEVFRLRRGRQVELDTKPKPKKKGTK